MGWTVCSYVFKFFLFGSIFSDNYICRRYRYRYGYCTSPEQGKCCSIILAGTGSGTGVTVQKQSSNIVMFLTMTSKDSVYNSLYLTNYAKLNLVDQLSRVPGVGAVNVMEQVIIPCVSGWILKLCVSGTFLRHKYISPFSLRIWKCPPAISVNRSDRTIKMPFNIHLMYRGDLFLRSNSGILSFVGNRMGNASPERYCANRFGVCFL